MEVIGLAERHFELVVTERKSLREAAQGLSRHFRSLPEATRGAILECLLAHPWLDRGGTWRLFFGEDPEDATRVSWLLGQLKIDLPYDRAGLRRALEIGDVDARRQASFEVVRRFDRATETRNARRLADELRRGAVAGCPAPVILAGRESRAFGNQAFLLADSKHVMLDDGARAALQGLVEACEAGCAQLAALSPRAAKAVLHVGPYLGRLRHLGSGATAPQTQLTGAVHRFHESLDVAQGQVHQAIHAAHLEADDAHREEGVGAGGGYTSEPFFADHELVGAVLGPAGSVARALQAFKDALARCVKVPAAQSILLQRPSLTGSERFKANELHDKPEQENALRKLVRLAGERVYMSPSLDFVAEATDIIEAVPLFIHEHFDEAKGKSVYEVDQDGLELAIRSLADPWAENIDRTLRSEYVALARELVLERRAADAHPDPEGVRGDRAALAREILAVSDWVQAESDRDAEKIELLVEESWLASQFIDRLQALRLHLAPRFRADRAIFEKLRAGPGSPSTAASNLGEAFAPRRTTPAFHLLTTEAPGLVEGFIQVILEEEMALRNIVRATRGAEAQVAALEQTLASHIVGLAETVIAEAGYGALVDEYARAGGARARSAAVERVLGEHAPLQEEVALLGVLGGLDGCSAEVARLLAPAHAGGAGEAIELEAAARLEPSLAGHALLVSRVREARPQELSALCLSLARERLAKARGVHDLRHAWYRSQTALRRTTARRRVVEERGLQHLLHDPRHAYSAGVLLETADGRLRPTGYRKRYHLVYSPSRVNLGKGERASVEAWPQWVGVADPLCANHAMGFYRLVNFEPQVRTVREAENLKVSENQWAALVRSLRNVQAFFVSRLGVGDIEDLAQQFNVRQGLRVAVTKGAESYMSGPIAGYCIPKDLLFKLFVATNGDDRKMTQVGVPAAIQERCRALMVDIAQRQRSCRLASEWERWTVAHLSSPSSTSSSAPPSFNLAKLSQVLGFAGIPNPLCSSGADLNAVLWSNWAESKITLSGEQVNRSTVFSLCRAMPEGVELARRLNPGCAIAPASRIRIHMYGTYKGDEDAPSPPDVRYSWTMRAFMILAGRYEEIAASLDREGQLIARLCWCGYNPASEDPRDAAIGRYLADKFAGKERLDPEADAALVARLAEAFPAHGPAGDVTMTVVPGVSADDLLGFSAETLDLLKADAEAALAHLQRCAGMTEEQIRANAQLHRPIDQWTGGSADPHAREIALRSAAALGPAQSLVLKIRGPGVDFLRDLQGQDVAVFSVTHPEVMALDPAHLRDLMMTGLPASALSVVDAVSQGRHRVWFDRDIMLWYAAARARDALGAEIADWSKRPAEGRQAVYYAFGYGAHEYRPLIGHDLRDEVACQELRAAALYRAIVDEGRAWSDVLDPATLHAELQYVREYEQFVLAIGRHRPRDSIIRRAVEDLVVKGKAAAFTEVHWLALGGALLLNGAAEDRLEGCLAALRSKLEVSSAGRDPRVDHLVVPRVRSVLELGEKKGEMMSVKASEQVAHRARLKRSELVAHAAREVAARVRQEACRAEEAHPTTEDVVAGLVHNADVNKVARASGVLVARLCRLLHHQLPSVSSDAVSRLSERQEPVTPKLWHLFVGTYESQGLLVKVPNDDETSPVSSRGQIISVLTTLLALDSVVLPALLMAKGSSSAEDDADNDRQFFRDAASFFAATLDDHFYEYTPWALDPARGLDAGGHFDSQGVLRAERREAFYELCWQLHAPLYPVLRAAFEATATFRAEPREAVAELLGDTSRAAIGAGAPSRPERLWRTYGQLRELAFAANDGFALPVVFPALDLQHQQKGRPTFAFLSPTGRTHFSRALLEAEPLGCNIVITRDARVQDDLVAVVDDGVFYLSAERYEAALVASAGLTAEAAQLRVSADRASGRLGPKGIRVAARFTRPVPVAAAVTLHHHYLQERLESLGYPATDKSSFLFELTYNKSLYPQIFTDGSLPDEVDWLRDETEQALAEGCAKDEVLRRIAERVRPFLRRHRILIVKGAAESGARNLQRFDAAHRADGGDDEACLAACSEFVFEVSQSQHVVIQRAIVTSPLAWMSADAARRLVDRQVEAWGVAVNLTRHPKNYVYGSLRVIMTAGHHDGDRESSWEASHALYLASLQIATNVGRQGTLEILHPSHVDKRFREQFAAGLEAAGRRAMASLARFGKRYWEEPTTLYGVTQASYRDRHPGAPAADAAGTPYHWPRYLMLDFIPEPIWGSSGGKELEGPVAIEDITLAGDRTRFTVRDARGALHEDAAPLRFHYWLLEPNVGIGLWPNYTRREEVAYREAAAGDGEGDEEPLPWWATGRGDRAVLSRYLEAGEAFLRAKGLPVVERQVMKEDRAVEVVGERRARQDFSTAFEQELASREGSEEAEVDPLCSAALVRAYRRVLVFAGDEVKTVKGALAFLESPERRRELCGRPGCLALLDNEPLRARLAELLAGAMQGHSLTPPVVLCPPAVHAQLEGPVLAVVSDAPLLLENHVFPFAAAERGAWTVIGVRACDLVYRGGRAYASRALVPSPGNRLLCAMNLHLSPATAVPLTAAICLELHGNEGERHAELAAALRAAGVTVVNDPRTVKACDDKALVRYHDDLEWRLVPRGSGPVEASALLAGLLGGRGVVIKPRLAGTGGREVRYFASAPDALAATLNLARRSDVVVTRFAGDLVHGGRRVVLRVNVCCGRATTVTACKGKERGEEFVVRFQAGRFEAVPLRELGAVELAVTAAKAAAERAVAALVPGARFAPSVLGVDVVVEGDDKAGCHVLEVNARPGLLIFGEDGGFGAPPVDAGFWRLLDTLRHPIGLQEMLEVPRPFHPRVAAFLAERYADPRVHGDRVAALLHLLGTAPAAVLGGPKNGTPLTLVASPGRDRVFMGHTDLPGLGGFTVNSITVEEVLAVARVTSDGLLHLSSDGEAAVDPVPVSEVLRVAADPDSYGRAAFDPARWTSYVLGALAYLVSGRSRVGAHVRHILLTRSAGLAIHFATTGALELPRSGGLSSSTALTSAFALALDRALGLGLPLEDLCMLDYGEYYLGKTAGAADKCAQLLGSRGMVSVIGSLPDRLLRSLAFPTRALAVFVAESPIPRLVTPAGRRWLVESRGLGEAAADRAVAHCRAVLDRCGSRAFVEGARLIRERLAAEEEESWAREARAALEREGGQLRALAGLTPATTALRALRLLDDQQLRAACLYGLAEIARGRAYLEHLEAAGRGTPGAVEAVLRCVQLAHDGDRALADPCTGQPTAWAADPRSDSSSDAAIDALILGGAGGADLVLATLPGRFERSLPELDAWVDAVAAAFPGTAAARVAGAGLGGSCTVHVAAQERDRFVRWVEDNYSQLGWRLREVGSGSPAAVVDV